MTQQLLGQVGRFLALRPAEVKCLPQDTDTLCLFEKHAFLVSLVRLLSPRVASVSVASESVSIHPAHQIFS